MSPGERERAEAELRSVAEDAESFVERCRRLLVEGVASGEHDPDPPSDL